MQKKVRKISKKIKINLVFEKMSVYLQSNIAG